MSHIVLSPQHGVNPSLELCFWCQKERGLVLFGRLKGDVEAPRKVTINKEPCDECKGHMEKGIVLISTRDPAPSRSHKCLSCQHGWRARVEKSEHTHNVSGEATPFCPKCNSRSISSSPVEEDDPQNPYRTGGWVVVTEDALRRWVSTPETLNHILQTRVAFMPDEVWDAIGLPRTKGA